MCMKNYGVSHADGYKQSSGQFAEAYNRGDFARKEPVVQSAPQEVIPTEPPVNQPFVAPLTEEQQSPLWNPKSLAEPADLPIEATPVVQDTPSTSAVVQSKAKTDAQMDYENKTPLPSNVIKNDYASGVKLIDASPINAFDSAPFLQKLKAGVTTFGDRINVTDQAKNQQILNKKVVDYSLADLNDSKKKLADLQSKKSKYSNTDFLKFKKQYEDTIKEQEVLLAKIGYKKSEPILASSGGQ